MKRDCAEPSAALAADSAGERDTTRQVIKKMMKRGPILASALMATMTAAAGLLASMPGDAVACTRIFWNTNPGLMIVGRNEDYVTASHPTLVATLQQQSA